jgi:hypothetical protein
MPFPSLAIINNVLDNLYIKKREPDWQSIVGKAKSTSQKMIGAITGHSNDEAARRASVKTLKANAESANSVDSWMQYSLDLQTEAEKDGAGLFSETCHLLRNYVIHELTSENNEIKAQFHIRINETIEKLRGQTDELREIRKTKGTGADKKIVALEETIKSLAVLDVWQYVDKAMQRKLFPGLKVIKADELPGHDVHESRPLCLQANSRKHIFRKEYQSEKGIHIDFDNYIKSKKCSETTQQNEKRLQQQLLEIEKLKQKKVSEELQQQNERLRLQQEQRSKEKESLKKQEIEWLTQIEKVKVKETDKSQRFPSYSVINGILDLYITKKAPLWASPSGIAKGTYQRCMGFFTGYSNDEYSRRDAVDKFKISAGKTAGSVLSWIQLCFDLEEMAAQASGEDFNETCHLLRNYIIDILTSADDEIHAQFHREILALRDTRKKQEEALHEMQVSNQGKGTGKISTELELTIRKLAVLEDWEYVDKAIDRKLITHLKIMKVEELSKYEHPEHIHESRPLCWQKKGRHLIFHKIYQSIVDMTFDGFVLKQNLQQQEVQQTPQPQQGEPQNLQPQSGEQQNLQPQQGEPQNPQPQSGEQQNLQPQEKEQENQNQNIENIENIEKSEDKSTGDSAVNPSRRKNKKNAKGMGLFNLPPQDQGKKAQTPKPPNPEPTTTPKYNG